MDATTAMLHGIKEVFPLQRRRRVIIHCLTEAFMLERKQHCRFHAWHSYDSAFTILEMSPESEPPPTSNFIRQSSVFASSVTDFPSFLLLYFPIVHIETNRIQCIHLPILIKTTFEHKERLFK